jgi:hypothetical protein
MAEPQELRAQTTLTASNIARDGWLFIGIGQFSILAGTLTFALFRQFGPQDVFATALGVSVAAWCVLTGVGVFKLSSARRQGVPVLTSVWSAAAVYGLCAIALVVVIAFVHDAVDEMSHDYPWLPYSLPWTIACGYLLLGYFFRPKTHASAVRRSLLTALVMFGFGITTCIPEWGAWKRLSQIVQVNGDITTAELSGCIQLLIWQFLGVLGIRRYIQARRSDEHSLGADLLLWSHVLLTIEFLLACYPYESLSGFVATLLMPPSLAAVFLIGRVLASRRAPMTRWRVACFCAPLAAFSLLLLVPAAGIVTTVVHFSFSGEEVDALSREWSWHLPEFVRAMLTKPAAAISPLCDQAFCHTGLLTTADLKAHALAAKPRQEEQQREWLIWRERDPADALQTALSVPVYSLPGIAATSYDYAAGYEIAVYGSKDDIHKRLSGAYSDQLRSGILVGLIVSRSPTEEFSDDIVACIQKGCTNLQIFGVRALTNDPQRATQCFCDCIDNPTQTNLIALSISRGYWQRMKASQKLIDRSLASNNVTVRSIGLRQSGDVADCLKRASTNDLLHKIIESAEGNLPSSDAMEQRYGLFALREYFSNRSDKYVNYANSKALLSAQEIQELDDLCARAKKQLSDSSEPLPRH